MANKHMKRCRTSCIMRKLQNKTLMNIPMFRAVVFTIAKRWKQPKCPSMDEWINKMCYIHAMEYCAASEKEGNPITCYNIAEPWGHYIKWNKPITKRQIQVQLYEISKVVKFIDIESRMIVTRGWGKGAKRSCCLMSIEFQFCKKVLEISFTTV